MSVFIAGGTLAHATDYPIATIAGLTPDLLLNATTLTFPAGWHHISLIAANNSAFLFIDGFLSKQWTLASTLSITTPTITLHALPSPFYHYIRELRLISEALSIPKISIDTMNSELILHDYTFVAYF